MVLRFISSGSPELMGQVIGKLYAAIEQFEGVREREPKWSADTKPEEVLLWIHSEVERIRQICDQHHGTVGQGYYRKRKFDMAIVYHSDQDVDVEFSIFPYTELTNEFCHMSVSFLPVIAYALPRLHKLAVEVLRAFIQHTGMPAWAEKWEHIEDLYYDAAHGYGQFDDDEHHRQYVECYHCYDSGDAFHYDRRLSEPRPYSIERLTRRVDGYGRHKKQLSPVESLLVGWLKEALDVMKHPDCHVNKLINLPYRHLGDLQKETPPILPDEYMTFQWDFDDIRDDLDQFFQFQCEESYVAETLYAASLTGHTKVPELPAWIAPLDKFMATGNTIKNDIKKLYNTLPKPTKRRTRLWPLEAQTFRTSAYRPKQRS